MSKQKKPGRKPAEHKKTMPAPNFSGQHFLHNPRTIKSMLRISCIQPHETVLEIGPGKGALTWPLAELAHQVIAVEQDVRLAYLLKQKGKAYPGLRVEQADFRMMRLPAHPFCVVSNIPYSITTAILDKLLGPEGGGFQRGALIMELGAAKRFTRPLPADPGVLCWRMNFEMDIIQTVPRGHFSPPPRVDGAIVRIVRRKYPLLASGQYRRFYSFAAYILKSGRCPLHETLGRIFTAPQLKRALKEAKADRQQSGAALSIPQWAVLFQAMVQHVQPYRWPK